MLFKFFFKVLIILSFTVHLLSSVNATLSPEDWSWFSDEEPIIFVLLLIVFPLLIDCLSLVRLNKRLSFLKRFDMDDIFSGQLVSEVCPNLVNVVSCVEHMGLLLNQHFLKVFKTCK